MVSIKWFSHRLNPLNPQNPILQCWILHFIDSNCWNGPSISEPAPTHVLRFLRYKSFSDRYKMGFLHIKPYQYSRFSSTMVGYAFYTIQMLKWLLFCLGLSSLLPRIRANQKHWAIEERAQPVAHGINSCVCRKGNMVFKHASTVHEIWPAVKNSNAGGSLPTWILDWVGRSREEVDVLVPNGAQFDWEAWPTIHSWNLGMLQSAEPVQPFHPLHLSRIQLSKDCPPNHQIATFTIRNQDAAKAPDIMLQERIYHSQDFLVEINWFSNNRLSLHYYTLQIYISYIWWYMMFLDSTPPACPNRPC